ERTISIDNTDLPDGSHQCMLSGERIDVLDGRISNLQLASKASVVLSVVGAPVVGKTVVAFQVNGYATKPGEVIGRAGSPLIRFGASSGFASGKLRASTLSSGLSSRSSLAAMQSLQPPSA
ncbi:MAG: hypothetical protein MUO41_14200, partial [Methyloceanibacter sp.]|nr:hypothetical protein [Methyloceanibacter sp.]